MKMKGDCQVDYIKEAFDKLYNCVMPYIDLTQFSDADTAFKELNKKVHSEIYILKKCLAERDRAVEAGITRSKVLQERISDLESENNAKQHVIESFVAKVNDLEKKIRHLEIENANLRVTPADANVIEVLERENRVLRAEVFKKGDELRKANNQIVSLKNDLKMAEARIEAQKKTLDEERKHGEELANINGQLVSSRTGWCSRAQHAEKRVMDLNEKIHDLEEENANLRVTPADANVIEVLERENRVLRCDNKKLAAACEDNKRLREVIDTLEKEINTLKKKIHELEEENANLRVTPDDANAIRVKSLERANEILRRENGTLWTTLEKRDIGERTCYESLSETIDFQNKKIEELEADKARLKEAVDIQKTTFKKLEENVDLSYGHEFEFGDEVFVPWSCDPYMYVKRGMMYNPRTKRLVYVGKDQHLKWFGDKFSIV